MKEDDDDDENNFAVTKYPCMPSLVALQQMRNRLHLAFLGKKLMKWTMMATGRELRRIAGEIDEVYHGFDADIRNAYIMLARSRYFYPNLNKMVLEDVCKRAGVVVVPKYKAMSGVKLMHYQTVETEAKPYPHLGIEKGGQTILETKKEWLELLKRLILMLQLRSSFLAVEASNKAATKRMNVLKKIVIPRTNVTVEYIISELEELAREEFHRLKKVKEKKNKGKYKDKKHEGLCPVCIEDLNNEQIDNRVKTKIIPTRTKDIPSTPVRTPELSAASSWEIGTVYVEQIPESALKLEYIKKHINELITLGKSFIDSGVDYIDLDEFLRICENAKAKLDEVFVGDEGSSQYKGDYDARLEHFKGHLRDVIELAKDLNVESVAEPSVCNFIQACESIDEKLNTDAKQKTTDKSRLQKLDSHIDDVVKITREYKRQGLLSPSVEEFVKSCKAIKLKIKEYSEQESRVDKINHLKQHVGDLEVLTGEMKNKGLESRSIDNFSKSCKKFKDKLDRYAKPGGNAMELSTLIEQIDETIGLSMEAKDIGVVGDSIEDLVKSSEKLKKKIAPVQDTKSKILQSLKTNIDDVMGLIDSYKEEGLVTDSVEDFLRTCEVARKKIEGYEVLPPRTETETEPPCLGRCVSCNESFQTEVIMPEGADVCRSCHKIYQKEIPIPCESCTDEMTEFKLPSDSSICETCSNVNEPELSEVASETSENVSKEVYCDICKKVMKEDHEHEPIPVDSKAGYYERKIRKITKVKRSQNPDGTIREETETISIRKIKREPTETSLEDDDDDDSTDDEACVAVCILNDHNQRGFHPRLIKSECVLDTNSVTTELRSCVSIGTFCNNGTSGLNSTHLY